MVILHKLECWAVCFRCGWYLHPV